VNILVIGGGGREHALVWKLAQDTQNTVFASPGNPGCAELAYCLPDVTPLAAAELVNADLTVVGPEQPLVEGVVDQFRAAGRKIVGPSAANARLEGSKVFAKQFFARHSIPTARFLVAATQTEALEALSQFKLPVVLKVDGLAAGKGVIVAHTAVEAVAAIETLGAPLVLEEFLEGEEVSFIVLSDGESFVPLEPCQDHKAAFDGDAGPNTGGMGAYCDSRILTHADTQCIIDTVIEPTIRATQFTGFLYAGLMMTATGPKLLEFNARLGDPETQVIMHRMQSNWGELLMRAANRDLAGASIEWNAGPSLCVVLTAAGYPGPFERGHRIDGIAEADAAGATVFQAGTARIDDDLVTNGGRVLAVTASGDDLLAAREHAYAGVSRISFEGMHFRHDIGAKGLRRWERANQ
jgi:phosphoribosylamine---glycine ligase